MIGYDFVESYQKTLSVIDSCETEEQFIIASNYANLFFEKFKPAAAYMDIINNHLEQQQEKLK